MDAILDAAARLLVKEGPEALTTNRLAKVAGVSVGSLYQYFEGRDAVVAALQDRHFREMGQSFLDHMELLLQAPIDQFIEQLAAIMRTSPLLNSKLSRLLLAYPTARKPPAVGELERRCADLLERYLLQLRPDRNRAELVLPTFLVVQTVEHLILATSRERPPGVTREKYTRELAQLVLRYLAPVVLG